MTQEIITGPWSADPSTLLERVCQALAVIDEAFPRATYWRARPSHPTGPNDAFIVEGSVIHPDIGNLVPLWGKTTTHFSERSNGTLDDLVVRCGAYSDKMTIGVSVFFSSFLLTVETEPEVTKRALTEHLGPFLDLLRHLGGASSIGGCWLRHHAAFAGDPVYLYEPMKLFSKFNSPLTYEEVTQEVRSLRDLVRNVITTQDFEQMLTDLGAEVEKISANKLFVRLGDPLKEKGGYEILKKLEKEISLALKRVR